MQSPTAAMRNILVSDSLKKRVVLASYGACYLQQQQQQHIEV